MSSNNIPLKLLQGTRNSLDSEALKPGYIYYCIDSNELFFDFETGRKCLNPYIYDEIYGNTEINPDVKGLINKQDKEIIDTAVRFALQELTDEQKKQARLNINAVGENVTGKNLTVDGSNAVLTASNGAEIFNDYEYNVASGEYSHAEGCGTSALGDDSHAEGLASMTIGFASHAEGYLTTAAGDHSHAEGYGMLGNTTILSGDANATTYTVTGWHSGCKAGRYIAYGNACALIVEASSDTSTLVLDKTLSTEALSGAECILISNGIAYGTSSHVEGYKNIASGNYSHAEGRVTKALDVGAHAEGINSEASSEASHAEGYYTTASGDYSHAEGEETTASGNDSHAEGFYTNASGENSHAEGDNSIASGKNSHAEGTANVAYGESAHAEGSSTVAYGKSAHAEGLGAGISVTVTGNANATTYNVVVNNPFFKEGGVIKYNDVCAKIVSFDTTNRVVTLDKTLSSAALSSVSCSYYVGMAYGYYSHSEGAGSTAVGTGSHAEGASIAIGDYSHAEGSTTFAYGMNSHAEGEYTIANGYNQHVQGRYNIPDENEKYAHILGNGTTTKESNAHTVDWSGNAWFAGDVYIGGTSMDDAIKLEVAKPYMTKVTLTTTGWDTTTLTQVATIEGIKADETAQAIYINPVFDGTMIDEIGSCNVYASAQGENSITFSCDSVPTIDVEFYVKWQDVIWIKPILPPPNLIDFEYNYDETNDTYTLTSWKETLNGVASTEMIVPDDHRIIL